MFVLGLGLTNCPTAICHLFRPVYEHGRRLSVYEHDCRYTKYSIEAAGTPATGPLLHMGLVSGARIWTEELERDWT